MWCFVEEESLTTGVARSERHQSHRTEAVPAAAAAPLAARTAGRVLSRQERFEETVYQP